MVKKADTFLLWIRPRLQITKKNKQIHPGIKDISISAALRISTYCETDFNSCLNWSRDFASIMCSGSLFQKTGVRKKKEWWNWEDLCFSFGLIWKEWHLREYLVVTWMKFFLWYCYRILPCVVCLFMHFLCTLPSCYGLS